MRQLNPDELLHIAGGGGEDDCETKEKGNNGYGNGGEDGVPGNSADNPAPNAGEKADDVVR